MEERKKRGMEVEKSREGGRRIQGIVELHTSVHLPPFVEGHPQCSCLTASPVPSIPPPPSATSPHVSLLHLRIDF